MNENTIDFYNKNAQNYADSTFNLDVKNTRDKFAENIPSGGKILDAGCGSGRDVLAFSEMGFKVVGIDASKELVEIAKKNTKQEIHQKSFSEINWKSEFDGVWCMASLLHLNKLQLTEALSNIGEALKPSGKLYASFKSGEGESYDDKGRFFKYQSEKELKETLENSGLFNNVKFSYNEDAQGRKDTQWINVTAESNKPELKLQKRTKLKM